MLQFKGDEKKQQERPAPVAKRAALRLNCKRSKFMCALPRRLTFFPYGDATLLAQSDYGQDHASLPNAGIISI